MGERGNGTQQGVGSGGVGERVDGDLGFDGTVGVHRIVGLDGAVGIERTFGLDGPVGFHGTLGFDGIVGLEL